CPERGVLATFFNNRGPAGGNRREAAADVYSGAVAEAGDPMIHPDTRGIHRHEEDVSAEQPEAQEDARLPHSHAHPSWTATVGSAPGQGPRAARSLRVAMAPERRRGILRRGTDVRRVVRTGKRGSGTLMVVYVAPGGRLARAAFVCGRRV